jgi:hypothetical protein
VFSASTLSDAEAELIAGAYYRSGKNPRGMAAALGVATFDLELIRHPLVKRHIVRLAERMRQLYTMEDHLSRLQEIRDAAMEAGNLRIALASELAVGKAAGLYEKIGEAETGDVSKLEDLSSQEIRQRLARLEAAGGTLPAPDREDFEEEQF